MENKNIVINKSTGFNYSYASLSDIAEQGIEIPKMKTVTEEGHDYIAYWDADLSDWVRGAMVVIPEAKGMNEAQRYASAVTYARRVTVQLAKGLACRDDDAIEDTDENGDRKTYPKASQKQVEYLTKLYDAENRAKICEYYKVEQLSDLRTNEANEAISKALKRNEERNK